MARIEPLFMPQVDERLRHLCEYAEKQTGTSASPRTYAKNPAAMLALAGFRAALEKDSALDPVLKELVRLKIAALNDTTLFIGLGRFNEVIGLEPS